MNNQCLQISKKSIKKIIRDNKFQIKILKIQM